MKKHLQTISIILLVIIALFGLTSCGYHSEHEVVKAEIINKEYVKSHSDYGYHYDFMKGDFRWKFKTIPAEYNVTVKYGDITATFNNRSLYDTYDIGEFIEVTLTSYYDPDGNISSQSLYRRN